MTRIATALAALAGLAAAPATAQTPVLGKSTQFEFTESQPKRGTGRVYEFPLSVQQGDKYRFQLQPVGGAKIETTIFVHQSAGNGKYKLIGTSPNQVAQDWTMPDPASAPLKVNIVGYSLGKVNLLVTKVGPNGPTAAPGGDGADALVEQLRAENALLRRQVDELRRLLDQKK